MDLNYLVKQLDTDIAHLEAQLREKRTSRDKLWSALSPVEQTMFLAPKPEKKVAEPKPEKK